MLPELSICVRIPSSKEATQLLLWNKRERNGPLNDAYLLLNYGFLIPHLLKKCSITPNNNKIYTVKPL